MPCIIKPSSKTKPLVWHMSNPTTALSGSHNDEIENYLSEECIGEKTDPHLHWQQIQQKHTQMKTSGQRMSSSTQAKRCTRRRKNKKASHKEKNDEASESSLHPKHHWQSTESNTSDHRRTSRTAAAGAPVAVAVAGGTMLSMGVLWRSTRRF